MKMDLINRLSVYTALCICDECINSFCVCFYLLGDRQRIDQRNDLSG